MIKASKFWKILEEKGYNFFSGVPCSILETVYHELATKSYITYIPAVRENVALGIASGACLMGRKSGILMQNSGLGNIVNTLTSFNLIYKIPVLMFITWRGHMGKDAPEHIVMGKKTLKLLKNIGIPTVILDQDPDREISWAIDQAQKKNIPVGVIIKKGVIR